MRAHKSWSGYLTGQTGGSIVYTMSTNRTEYEPWDYCVHCGQHLAKHVADQPCYMIPDYLGRVAWRHMCYTMSESECGCEAK